MNCNCPACQQLLSYAEPAGGFVHICPHCSVRMILPAPGEPPVARLLRRPPKPPIFGIRIHPLAAVAILLLLVAVGLLIVFASNPNFLPTSNPIQNSSPSGPPDFNPLK